MTGSIDRCSPCVEYVLTSYFPYQTCTPVVPSPAPPITPQPCGGILQQPYPPNVNPPNVSCSWAWFVNGGVQAGNIYWWNVEQQAWQ